MGVVTDRRIQEHSRISIHYRSANGEAAQALIGGHHMDMEKREIAVEISAFTVVSLACKREDTFNG
jgi:hypothetical protein